VVHSLTTVNFINYKQPVQFVSRNSCLLPCKRSRQQVRNLLKLIYPCEMRSSSQPPRSKSCAFGISNYHKSLDVCRTQAWIHEISVSHAGLQYTASACKGVVIYPATDHCRRSCRYRTANLLYAASRSVRQK
jgi:hypothetical protein